MRPNVFKKRPHERTRLEVIEYFAKLAAPPKHHVEVRDHMPTNKIQVYMEYKGVGYNCLLSHIELDFIREPNVKPGSLSEAFLLLATVQAGKKPEEPYWTLTGRSQRYIKYVVSMMVEHIKDIIDW